VEVFVEPILPPATLVVIGAGHVGKAVVHLAKWLGFRVAVNAMTVRNSATPKPPPARTRTTLLRWETAGAYQSDKRTYLVVTSRGSNVDAAGMPSA
jgi:xanthine dehydrogenase accessory factor